MGNPGSLPERRGDGAGLAAAVLQSSFSSAQSALSPDPAQQVIRERPLFPTENSCGKRGDTGSFWEPGFPGEALICVNYGSASSATLLLFQLDELQKKQYEANLAVTPLKVICS